MMPHPFEVKASTSVQAPDELMISWGNTPRGSVASIYLPVVASADIIALADAMYVKHRLSASDPHTVQCPRGQRDLRTNPLRSGPVRGIAFGGSAHGDSSRRCLHNRRSPAHPGQRDCGTLASATATTQVHQACTS